MIAARYLSACGVALTVHLQELATQEKTYANCAEFMADVKGIESKISKDGFRSNSSVMSRTTSSYNHNTGNFDKSEPEHVSANLWISADLKYFGDMTIGEISFSRGEPRIRIRYFFPSKPIDSGYVGLKDATSESVSVAEAYDIFKENLMSLDEAANMVVPLWCAASVGKDGLKFIQGVDPARLSDPKYIKREFTAKRAADLLAGKIVVVQYRGKGRTHTSGGHGCGVYRLQKPE